MDRKRANTGSSSLTERDSLLATDSNSSGSTERTSFYAATSSRSCHSPVDADSDTSVEEIDETQDCRSPTLLENSSSVARDHLASERTFLAYVRTSLAVVSAGVALSQMLIMQLNQHPHQRIGVFASLLSAACVSLGLAILFTGRSRYFVVQSALIDGKFPVSRLGASLIALALALLVILTFIVIFVYQNDMLS
ncbi:hypothetical protein BDN71DRAFT_1444659 [Pleurotus eryngii]|uniref:DUF202 domain-containing protein n=1 Tax=Pleurotus eryngii TaxID=5323 RepID=A0A9P6DAH8_PLEER|nr:hypothetical protein BDN71DRAFT_1444659 [Pleurotus eryngii]